MTYKMTEECHELFQLILKKLDIINKHQEDLLDVIVRKTTIEKVVWDGVVKSSPEYTKGLRRERWQTGKTLLERLGICKTKS